MSFSIDDLPNYTGPYRSDGQFQTSVPFGTSHPKDQLDALSRLHDTAYATYSDYGHRRAADVKYANDASKLMGLFPELAGFAVKYVNPVADSATTLIKNPGWMFGPLGGLIVGGVQNGLKLHDYMLNNKKYADDISQLYNKDPGTFKGPKKLDGELLTPKVIVTNKSGGSVLGQGSRVGSSNSTGPNSRITADDVQGKNYMYNPFLKIKNRVRRRRRNKNKNKVYIQ